MVKIRKIAVKGLEIFKTYSKNNGTSDMAIPEFNAKLTIAEKRTIIVALHKIGIPVTTFDYWLEDHIWIDCHDRHQLIPYSDAFSLKGL